MMNLPQPDILNQSDYQLAELLVGSNEQFLVNAYRAIVRRLPTEEEALAWLADPRLSGDRLMMLGNLRYSPEGRQCDVAVRGLARSYWFRRLQQLPLLGRAIGWFFRVLRIGRLEAKLNQTKLRLNQAEVRLDKLSQQLAQLGPRLQTRIEEQEDRQDSALQCLKVDSDSWRGEIAYAIATLRNEWKVTLARDSRAIEHAARALAEGQAVSAWAPPALAREQLYLDFEDTFRARWQVEGHAHWYMPLIRQVYDETATLKPCLDIGCGRGEFLVALKNNDFPCVGVDLNPAMADAARAQGLEVVVADAIAHLRGLDPGSVAVVSAFHLVEYLPFELTLHLIEAAKRVLIQGGLLILETPNPENLVVGACTFWYDPTRLRPLPPALLKFYVESADYESVRTARFTRQQPGPDTVTIDQPVLPSVDGPLDYAIIARKAS